MWVGRELINDLSSGSMPGLYRAVGAECGTANLQQLYRSARQHANIVRMVKLATRVVVRGRMG
jgi:hypothetical protein